VIHRIGVAVGLVALAVWFVLVHALMHHYIAGWSYEYIFWRLGIAVVGAPLVGLGVWLYERRPR
jgi:hypothetical protein